MLHFEIGLEFLDTGDHARAAERLREAVRLKPEWPEALCNLGLALKGAKRYREALEYLEQGHALGSKQASWSNPSLQWLEETRALAAEPAK